MKKIPEFKTDAAAEAFLEQDLSGLDFTQFKPMRFEIARKEATLNMRLPSGLLAALKEKAAAHGVPYTRYVRMLLEADIAHASANRTQAHTPASPDTTQPSITP